MKKLTLSTVMNYDKSNGYAKILSLDNTYSQVSFATVNGWDAAIDVYQQGLHTNKTPRHFKYLVSWTSLHELKVVRLNEDFGIDDVDTVLAQVPTENGVDLYVSSMFNAVSWVKTRIDVTAFSNQGKWIDGSNFVDISSLNPIYCKSSTVNNTAGYHNSIYRGKDLTNTYTIAELESKIASGDFSDLFIGDYITKTTYIDGVAESVDYVIAGFDYLLGIGNVDIGATSHHAVIVTRNSFKYPIRMEDSATTSSGYYGSKAHGIATISSSNTALTSLSVEYDTFQNAVTNSGTYTFSFDGTNWNYAGDSYSKDALNNTFGISYSGSPSNGDTLTVTLTAGYLERYRKGIYDVFGKSHCLSYKDFMTTTTTTGAWHTARVELMNECMVYGTKLYATNSEAEKTKSCQLPLFRLRPDLKVVKVTGSSSRSSYWLSSVSSNSSFCYFGSWGNADYHGANNTHGVRPMFLLG